MAKKKILAARSHQEKAFSEVNDLIIKERNNKVITLLDGTRLVEFCSCSYLGLDLDPRIIKAATKHLYKYGVSFPVARTRIRTDSLVTLEELLNQIFLGHSTTFVSLHLTHLGCLPVIASGEMPSFPIKPNGPLFILDKTAHASIQINRGIMQQFGEIDMVDFTVDDAIEKAFKQACHAGKTPIAISDSIGSMGGIAPVTFLLSLSDKYDGYAYFDDAHGTSIFGQHGAGYVLQQLHHTFHPRLILTASLSKGFGTNAGAIILPTKADEMMIKRFASTYLFGNPSPFSIIDSAIESATIHLSDEIYRLQKKLWDNVNYFDTLLHDHIVNVGKSSPIRGVMIGDEFKAIHYTKELRQRGFAVTAAMYPTVPKGQSILRIALSAAHSQQQIAALCSNIKDIKIAFEGELAQSTTDR